VGEVRPSSQFRRVRRPSGTGAGPGHSTAGNLCSALNWRGTASPHRFGADRRWTAGAMAFCWRTANHADHAKGRPWRGARVPAGRDRTANLAEWFCHSVRSADGAGIDPWMRRSGAARKGGALTRGGWTSKKVAEPGGFATFLLSEELVKPGPEGGGGGGEAEFPVQEGAAADAEAAGELVLGQTSLQALGLQQGGEGSGSSRPGRLIGSEGGQGQAAKRSRNPPLPPPPESAVPASPSGEVICSSPDSGVPIVNCVDATPLRKSL